MVSALEKKIRDAINWTHVWSEDDAIPVVAEIFDGIVDALKRTPQFQAVPRDEIDLLLVDCRNRAEQDIGAIVDGTIVIEHVIGDIVEELAP
jgi:hypothetical protein